MEIQQEKKCAKCGEVKSIDKFFFRDKAKGYYRSCCKTCYCEYFQENKEKIKEYKKEYHQENKEKIKEYQKEYHQKNKEKILESQKKYFQENKEKIRESQKEYHQKNKEKILESQKEYRRGRLKTDPMFKLICATRKLCSSSFRRFCNGAYKKSVKTETLIGCTLEEYVNHLVSQFQEGMTLENYGKWHMDHIIPISSAETIEELNKLNHYSNIQPLWAEENLSKSNKLNWENSNKQLNKSVNVFINQRNNSQSYQG